MDHLPSWISHDSAAWFTFFYAATVWILSLLRQDNPVVKISLTTQQKMMLVGAITFAQTALHALLGGVGWLQALTIAITSEGAALTGHGFRDTISMPPSGGVIASIGTPSGAAMVIPNKSPSSPPAAAFGHQQPMMKLALIFGMIAIMFLGLTALVTGCTAPQVAGDIVLAECITDTFFNDVEVKHMTDEQAGIDTAAVCVTDVPMVLATVQDAKQAPMKRRMQMHMPAADAGK